MTALYHRGDPYETSDAVFGVKTPLLFELDRIGKDRAEKYGMKQDDWLLQWHFKIITAAESKKLVEEKNTEALKKVNVRFTINEDGLPEAAPLD